MSEMKNWKQILKYVHIYTAIFSSQCDAGGFHWESSLFIYSSKYFFHFQSIFALSWGKRQLKAAEVSWGCCLLFARVPLFFSPVHLQALPTSLSQGWWKCSKLRICIPESCTVPTVLDPNAHYSRDGWRSGSFPVSLTDVPGRHCKEHSHSAFVP